MRIDSSFLRGSYTPVVTPFRNGKIALDVFARLVEWQVREGSHGIVVCGTTGEATSLTVAERESLFQTAVRTVAGRVPVVAGTGAAAYEETIDVTSRAVRAGVDALLIVTPFYIRPPQRGLVEYFAAVASRTELPVLIYHIPGRASITIAADTVEAIAVRAKNLVGIKHASSDLELVSELVLRLGADFRIFCGLEALSLPMLVTGGAGLMNAVGNLAPGRVAALCDAVRDGQLETAKTIHFELFALNRAIFLDTNPIPLKYMMAKLGLLETPEVRLPLVALDEKHAPQLDRILREAGLVAAVPAEPTV